MDCCGIYLGFKEERVISVLARCWVSSVLLLVLLFRLNVKGQLSEFGLGTLNAGLAPEVLARSSAMVSSSVGFVSAIVDQLVTY